jgi:hypothetical protein
VTPPHGSPVGGTGRGKATANLPGIAAPHRMNRRQLRRYGRGAPPRHCHWCGADVTKLFDPDAHVAKHLEAEFGIPRGTGRRQSRENDAGRR